MKVSMLPFSINVTKKDIGTFLPVMINELTCRIVRRLYGASEYIPTTVSNAIKKKMDVFFAVKDNKKKASTKDPSYFSSMMRGRSLWNNDSPSN